MLSQKTILTLIIYYLKTSKLSRKVQKLTSMPGAIYVYKTKLSFFKNIVIKKIALKIEVNIETFKNLQCTTTLSP